MYPRKPSGMAIGPRIAHGADDLAAGKCGVARDDDLADLHLGAFIDVERELYGVRAGESFVGGLDGGELAAMLGQQLLQIPLPPS